MQKVGKALANDLIRTIEKAHTGKLPAVTDAGPSVSVGHFSRNALRVPLDEDTLVRMDRCTMVSAYDVSCRGLSCRSSLKRVRTVLAVSVNFSGVMNDGTPVLVSPEWGILGAEIVLENHEWRLSRLIPMAH